MLSLPTWREQRAQCPPQALVDALALYSSLLRDNINLRRLQAWRENLNDCQCDQVSRSGNEEDRSVTVCEFEDAARYPRDRHTANRTAESANAYYRGHRPAWK